jgi:hypothetical protein
MSIGMLAERFSPGTSKVSEAPGVGPYSMIVGIAVMEMSSTGQTGAPTMVLTSVLLPWLNGPTTTTRT